MPTVMVTFVQATYAVVTIVQISNIGMFKFKFFLTQNFFRHKITFQTQNFVGPKIVLNVFFQIKNFFWNQIVFNKIFQTQIYFGPHFFQTQNFFEIFIQTKKNF